MGISAFGVDHGDISKGFSLKAAGAAIKGSFGAGKKAKNAAREAENIRVAQTENNLKYFSSDRGRQSTKPPRPGQLTVGYPGHFRGIGPMPRGGPYKKG